MSKTESALTRRGTSLEPLGLLRQMTSEFERMFDEFTNQPFRWPTLGVRHQLETAKWFPEVDVFEKNGRLCTRIDLPGMKREDIKVEVTDGYLAISGDRKNEVEETKEHVYRSEREYGSFYRTVPLPEGVKPEQIAATFSDGVLEVSVPLPPKIEPQARKIEIQTTPLKG